LFPGTNKEAVVPESEFLIFLHIKIISLFGILITQIHLYHSCVETYSFHGNEEKNQSSGL